MISVFVFSLFFFWGARREDLQKDSGFSIWGIWGIWGREYISRGLVLWCVFSAREF